jgi:hypothetical protein
MNTTQPLNHVLRKAVRGLFYAGVSTSFMLGAGLATAQMDAPDTSKVCPVYGMQDNNLADSQLFKIMIDPATLQTTSYNIGPEYFGYDLEGLAIHPITGQLFVSSGDDADDPEQIGVLYTINKDDGSLTRIGKIVDGEVSALAFSKDGSVLWGWVDFQGLITIDQSTGAPTMVWASEATVEDIAIGVNADGDEIIYGVSEDNLYAYNLTKNAAALEYCDKLPSEAEAIEVLPDGSLLYALHKTGDTRLYQFNMAADSCQIMNTAAIPAGYYDMEGLAVPDTCKLCPPGAWQYTLDSFEDGVETTTEGNKVGGTSFEIHGVAFKQQGDMITVAIHANLPLDGGSWTKDGVANHIGWGDLIFDFSERRRGARVGSKTESDKVYAVRFGTPNDSATAEKGLYKVSQLKNVSIPNAGFAHLLGGSNHVFRAGKTPSLGGYPMTPEIRDSTGKVIGYNTSHYFNSSWNITNGTPTSLGAGTLLSGLVKPLEFNLQDLNFEGAADAFVEPSSHYSVSKDGQSAIISFSFRRDPGMTGNFFAYLFTECLNDGILIQGSFDDCPND